MERSHEFICIQQALRTDKESVDKFDEACIKLDKVDSNNTYSKASENNKFAENSYKNIIDKQKVRQMTASRTEINAIVDLKSPAIKKSFDVSLQHNSKVPFLPLLSIRTNALEEIYKEIKRFKNNITDLEEKNKVSSQCIEINKVRICNMEEKYIKLKQKAGIGCTYEERREILNCKLKHMQGAWKKSIENLKKTIGEMEEEVKSLSVKADCIKSVLFKKGQQQKHLKKNMNGSSSPSQHGYHSCDLLNSSNNLKTIIHTPSWNSLHHQ